MMGSLSNRLVLLFLLALGLAGCDTVQGWFESKKAPPLPGDRISVLALEREVKPDPAIADLAVRLPKPALNAEWPQPGGYPDHVMQHLAAGSALREVWHASIGAGSDDDARLLSTPVVAAGKLFAIDAVGLVSAFEVKTGKRLWRFDTRPEDDEGGFGGGVSYSGRRLFAANGYGDVFGLDPNSGAVIWRHNIGLPVRSAPIITGGRVVLITYDNQTFVLDGRDGRQLWSHAGIGESASFVGTASPGAEGDVVIVPYSSGELFALRADNGRVAWAESIGSQQIGGGGLSQLNDIKGAPVIDRGMVFAISHGGRLAALDLRSGAHLWEQDLSGLNTPWVAGDFLFVLTTHADLICLSRERGRIRWVNTLPRFERPEKRKDPIDWSGPILLGDRLIVSGSDGDAVAISPYDGRFLGRLQMPAGVRVPPIAAGGTLYVLTEDGEIVAFR